LPTFVQNTVLGIPFFIFYISIVQKYIKKTFFMHIIGFQIAQTKMLCTLYYTEKKYWTLKTHQTTTIRESQGFLFVTSDSKIQ